jgi:ArsR family metal-binding transcriptional regulator
MTNLIEKYDVKLVEPECAPGSARYGATVTLPNDISAVFPYLNATEGNAWYDHQGKVLILRWPKQVYALRPNEIRIARAEDLQQAKQLADEFIGQINNTWERHEDIAPLYEERKKLSVIDILKLLPKTNCKKCGYPTCLAYAAALRQGDAQMESCLPVCQPENVEKKQKLEKLISGE